MHRFVPLLMLLASMHITTIFCEPLEPIFACKSNIQAKNSCHILLQGDDAAASAVAKLLAFDLDLSDKFQTTLKKTSKKFSSALCSKTFKEQADFVLHVSPASSGNWFKSLVGSSEGPVKVTLAQAFDGKELLSVTIPPAPAERIHQTHRCADSILQTLTGKNGFFQSTLAWCEKGSLMVADPSCHAMRPIVQTNTKIFAPTWHTQDSLLFYSRATTSKHILESVNLLTGHTKSCLSYKGLNMQLSLAPDGKKGVVVMSGGKGNSELFLYDQRIATSMGKKVFSPLTNNGHTNVAPCYLPNGDIIFCSDFETNLPQIYYLFMATKKLVRLTNGQGYCAAPAYCATNNSIIYTRPRNSIFQLYTLSLDGFDGKNRPAEKQLTFDGGNKTDPVWHPSGQMIAFVYEFINKDHKKEVQIALLNPASKRIHVATSGSTPKGFPAWSDKSWWYQSENA
jgi:Tol biopolymer transport system component